MNSFRITESECRLNISAFKPSRRWPLLAAAILAIMAVAALTGAQVQNANAPNNSDNLSTTWNGTVLLPNGRPAAGAGVSILCMQPGFSTLCGLSWSGSHSPGLPLSSEPGGWADAAGHFSIFTASNATAVLVADPQGFAMVGMDAVNSNQTVTLEPWGEITGRLLSGSTPAPNTRLAAVMPYRAFPGQRRFSIQFDAWTDTKGLFHFTNIPPGALEIGLADWMTGQGTNINFRGGALKTVSVQPGATVDLTLDAANALNQPKSAEQLESERQQAQMQAQMQAQRHTANDLPDPEPPLSGTVLLPDGKPAEGARVVRWGQGIVLNLSNAAILAPSSGPSRWATNPIVANTNRISIADPQGRFTLPEMIDTYAGSRTQWVFATRLDGYASATAESVRASRPMTLQPWGRIEGTLRLANNPATNAQVRLDSSAPNDYAVYSVSADTDQRGRFVLSNVPPERFTLFWKVRSGTSLGETGSSRPVDVRPGVVTTIALGESGRPIIGKLAANTPAPGLDWTKARLRISSSARWPIDSLYFQTAPSADGSFRFDDVPSGTYELSAELPKASTPGFTVAKITQQITVAEMAAGRKADDQDLGDIKMKVFFPWATAKIGDTVPPMQLTDLSGKPVKLEDFRGKYVLARFLGAFSTGADSFAAAIARAYRQDGRLIVVTVGYTSQEITWVANSDAVNNGDPCIYAYSGLPESDSCPPAVTMLLAPDGKVIATGLEGAGIRDAVVRALGTGQTNQLPGAARDDSITGTVLLPNGKPAAGATVAVSGNGNNPLAVGDNPGDQVQLNGTLLTTRMSQDNIKMLRRVLVEDPNDPESANDPDDLQLYARMFPLPDYTNGPVILADAQGKFRVPAKKIGQYLFASHPGGFAAIGPGNVQSPLTIQLKAWGFVAGIVVGGDGSQTNVSFALRGKIPIPNQTQDAGGSWYQGFSASPDSGGRFTFTNVVPGEYEVERLVTTHEGATTTSTGKNIAHLVVKPGEVTPLVIEEKFNPSTNTTPTNPPPALPPSSRATSNENSTVAGIGRPVIGKVLLPATVAKAGAGISLESADWPVKESTSLRARIASNGTFRVDNVPAGQWGFLLRGAGAYLTFARTILIPEMPGGHSDEPLDVGTLEPVLVKPHSPQIGETLPLFEVKTTQGGTFKLADQRGHYVLLDFEPLGTFPETASVEAAWADFGMRGRLSVLTLVVQPMGNYRINVIQREFPWPQTHLRDCPWYLQYPLRAALGLAVEGQAATTPATVIPGMTPPGWTPPVNTNDPDRNLPGALLIGPEGKVLSTNLHGDAIKAAVAAALGKK